MPRSAASACDVHGSALRAALRAVRGSLVAAACLAATATAVGGCAAGRPAAPDPSRRPDLGAVEVRAQPEIPAGVAAAITDARRLVGLGRRGDAFVRIAKAADSTPPVLEADRLLQDLLAGSRADAWIRQRTQDRFDREPGSADAAYLSGRIEPSPRVAAARFAAALRADPGHPWARMGAAISKERTGDHAGAERECWQVVGSAPWLALPWLWLGSTAWSRGSPAAAETFLREAITRAPDDPRPWTGLAIALDDLGRDRDAARAVVEAVARAPGDPPVLWSLIRLLERTGSPDDLRDALAAVDRARSECGDLAAVDVVRGRLLLALGRSEDSEAALLAARIAGASAGDVAVPLRAARVHAGRVADAVSGWLDELPLDPLRADSARAKPWRALQAAATRGESTAADADALAGALDACGWGREAEAVVARARARWPGDMALAARAGDLARFRAFLEELAARARDLRRRARAGDSPNLADAMAAIRTASVEHLGIDATQGLVPRNFPLLGAFAASTECDGAFRQEFEKRGLLLVVGARTGGEPDLIVGRLVSHRHGVRAVAMSTTVEYDEHVVESDGLPDGLSGRRGGLAGITLDRFVLIHLDVVRRGPAPEQPDLPFLPRPARDEFALRALDTPSEVANRIERSLVARGTLERDAFESVVRHERVHVGDAARMLPPWEHPLAATAFAVSHGFDGERMEQSLEARAAVGALIDSDEPRAALASLLAFLPAERGETPHVAGYRGAIEALVDEILRDLDSFPGIDVRWNVVQQLDVLTSEQCRELGRRIARRLWP